jgi:hypothetical protein
VLALVAVPAFGLTRLGPDLVSAWKAEGDAGQTAPADALARGPLTFDAPASTLMRYDAKAKDAGPTPARSDLAQEVSLVLDDWKFTAGPTDPVAAFDLAYNELLRFQFIINTFLIVRIPNDQFFLLLIFETIFDQQLLAQRPSPSPPASPTQ